VNTRTNVPGPDDSWLSLEYTKFHHNYSKLFSNTITINIIKMNRETTLQGVKNEKQTHSIERQKVMSPVTLFSTDIGATAIIVL
jgi:hypothetical protein